MSFVKKILASGLLAGTVCPYMGVSQSVAASEDSGLAFERRCDERYNNDDRRMDSECRNNKNNSDNSGNSNYNDKGCVESKTEKKLFVRGKKVSEKSRLVASLLALFGGPLGLNHFYAGNTGTGVLYLLTGGLFGIGSFVSFLKTTFGYYEDSEGNVIYNWLGDN